MENTNTHNDTQENTAEQTKLEWQEANRLDATRVRPLMEGETPEPGERGTCPFCGSEGTLHAYDHGGFHCFGECGGPVGQTFTNTEVLARQNDISLDRARELIVEKA